MKITPKNSEEILSRSVQISNGLKETSGDGPNLVFDSKYGIMFCAYMPGYQGSYGESRGRIALSYFPASQPTNIRFVTVAEGHEEYCVNAIGLGDGKVRILYEINSRFDGDHEFRYKDYDFLTDTLSEEKTIMVKRADGSLVNLNYTTFVEYLEANGCHQHTYWYTEQTMLGELTFFEQDGYTYGSAASLLAGGVLFRSKDHLATLEFFAVYPYTVQYGIDYKFMNGKIYAIVRTDAEKNSICMSTSDDMGKTWTTPIPIEESIQCRAKVVHYNGGLLMCYNYFNDETGYRPEIQQGRTSVRMRIIDNDDPNQCSLVADLYSRNGIVNIALVDIYGDLYFAYSTSECILEYQNGNPTVRGKDAVRYVKLGHLTPDTEEK